MLTGLLQTATQLALLTLSFPKSSTGYSTPVPLNGSSATLVPSTDESTIVYALPYDEISSFVNSVSEFPITGAEGSEEGQKTRRWVMQNHGRNTPSGNWAERTRQAFQDFKQLIQV